MHTGQAEGFNKTKKELLQFIGRKNSTGPLVKQSLDAGQLMLEELPVAPTAAELATTPVLKDLYQERVKLWVKEEKVVKNKLRQCFNIIMG